MDVMYHEQDQVDRATMLAVRTLLATQPKIRLIPASRANYDALIEQTPAAEHVNFEAASINAVSGWWCRPQNITDACAVLYFHGGGYVMGSGAAYRNYCSQIAQRVGAAVFVVDYGLAPEHPFPKALNDVEVAYRGLENAGFSKLVIAGDSAGGGLALSLIQLFSQKTSHGSPARPLGGVLLSPWTDLSLSGMSLDSRAEADPILSRESLDEAARQYLGNRDRRDRKASPLFGEFTGLPPILIQVGEDEILLDDARRTAEAIRAQGGDVRLDVWQGMTHVFSSNLQLEASKQALDQIGFFVRARFDESKEG
jgi:epsilon-lactone hydrolase